MTTKNRSDAIDDRNIRVSNVNSDVASSDPVVERLREAIRNAGGNKRVSALSGVPLGSLTNYLGGRQMPFGAALKIARACTVSLEWMAGREDAPKQEAHVLSTPMQNDDDLTYIDYYNIAASAGFGLCADEAEKPEKVAISKRFLRQDLGLEPNRALMLETRGDSMEPALRAGDRLVVDTRQQHILDGVHVLVVNGGLLVKRVSTEPDGKVRIASDNPLYPPFFTDISRVRWGKPDGDNTITVIGRVAFRLQAMS
ncbi:hypothetical protein CFR78_04400 [Komagataeibacter rhaeticus]|uniref:S24 family peptidase n=1 Tax=Komagataeibacter rhaeticus TaxID=215221 RepID=UPI000A040891|nr:S24 family peptidase [Komagataeibacter rhaeticus]PYD54216.1 hypothetical protein CFR78_04400 [Komagataeibacter rhaeticus]GBQ15142.1 S24 family peptidase [Komagataeibacter rhaeticus DSM 16663]